MTDTAVFSECPGGIPSDVTLQCVARAREAAGAHGGRVGCIAVGRGLEEAARRLASCADWVWVADGAEYETYVQAPYRRAVLAALAEHPAGILLFPASTIGDDLAPAVSEAVGAACVLDADQASVDASGWTPRRFEFDRKVVAAYRAKAGLPMAISFKDGVAGLPEPAAAPGEIFRGTAPLRDGDLAVRVLRREIAAKTVNLKAASVIVAAGAGVGNAEGFELVRELARALGAEIGATRAVVDAGWIPPDHQIGQTGATVRPDLYIACGISGAVQHRVGMMDARKIIAINTDPQAPIFRIAHYRIVGDLKAVLPRLTRLLIA